MYFRVDLCTNLMLKLHFYFFFKLFTEFHALYSRYSGFEAVWLESLSYQCNYVLKIPSLLLAEIVIGRNYDQRTDNNTVVELIATDM